MNQNCRCPHCGRPSNPITVEMVGCCPLCLNTPAEKRPRSILSRVVPVPFGDAYPDEDYVRITGRHLPVGV